MSNNLTKEQLKRFEIVIDEIRLRLRGTELFPDIVTQNAMAAAMNYSPGFFSQVKRGTAPLRKTFYDALEDLCKKCRKPITINQDFVLHGTGEPIAGEVDPLVYIDVLGSEEQYICRKSAGIDFAFVISDDSFERKYKPRDILLCRAISVDSIKIGGKPIYIESSKPLAALVKVIDADNDSIKVAIDEDVKATITLPKDSLRSVYKIVRKLSNEE